MQKITAEEIDRLKNYISSHRRELDEKEISRLKDEFIEKIRLYVQLYPNDTRTVERWRKWYSIVKEDLFLKKLPKKEIEILRYHLETFRVSDFNTAMRRLVNWIGRVSINYAIDGKTIKRINAVIGKYGYDFKEISQKC